MCEGDDYWIDPYKLQKQVDFLEENPEYGMVHTNFKVFHQERNVLSSNGAGKYKISEGDVFEELFRGCWIRTLTVCLRRDFYNNLPHLPEGAFAGDLYLFYEIALQSKVHFMNYESGVYRVLKQSASHISNESSLLRVFLSYRRLDYFYAERGNISENMHYLLDKKWFIWDMKYWLRNGNYEQFAQLENKKYLSFKKGEYGLYLIYKMSQIKIFFKIISFVVKWKLICLRKFN